DQATGSYHVSVEHKAAPAAQIAARKNVQVPAFPQSLIDSVPRRVSDPKDAPGDRVNFILIGSQDRVQAALKAAGWVAVDRTDKIDPNVDGERDYIRDSLTQTGMVVKTDYITPTDPVTTARTATGTEFKSDGRTLLVYLSDDSGNVSAGFSDLFCSVLKQNNP